MGAWGPRKEGAVPSTLGCANPCLAKPSRQQKCSIARSEFCCDQHDRRQNHVHLNSVQQMVPGELAGEGLQTEFSRHGLPPSESSAGHGLRPQRAPKQCPANGVRRIL